MKSFRDIIDALGVPALAEAFPAKESHVRVMKARNSIPPEHWGTLIALAEKRGIEGVTFDSLRQLRSSRFSPAPSTPSLSSETSEAAA
jgi:hypothetical protein